MAQGRSNAAWTSPLNPGPLRRRRAIRIALDARQLYRLNRRGIGKTLVDIYATLAVRRPDWDIVCIHQLQIPTPPLPPTANLRAKQVDLPGADRFNLWETVRLPLAAWTSRADVLHCPANTGPSLPGTPMVLTIHDLIPLEIAPDAPETAQWIRRVRKSAKAARMIVTPSNYSKIQIVERLGIAPEKIRVIGHAPDRKLKRITDPAELARVQQHYAIAAGQKYLFSFGAADPRKNTARLIEAYARQPSDLRAEYLLVIVGVQGAALEEFRALAQKLGVQSHVALHGFADEADLPALLSGASGLCFPSRSEGFGLPILDAFACHTPVFAGNKTSLPDVAGDAGLLVDPESLDAIAEGLHTFLSQPHLRATLADRGRERLKLFTWDLIADQYAEVFEDVVR